MQEPLSDQADLNVPVIGIQFSAHGVSVVVAFSVEILIAGRSAEGVMGPIQK